MYLQKSVPGGERCRYRRKRAKFCQKSEFFGQNLTKISPTDRSGHAKFAKRCQLLANVLRLIVCKQILILQDSWYGGLKGPQLPCQGAFWSCPGTSAEQQAAAQCGTKEACPCCWRCWRASWLRTPVEPREN